MSNMAAPTDFHQIKTTIIYIANSGREIAPEDTHLCEVQLESMQKHCLEYIHCNLLRIGWIGVQCMYIHGAEL
jgi:hypothetical protein